MIKYNQVTWYSKLLALILFVALPFIGFWAGMKYQEAISSIEPDTNYIKTPTGQEKLKIDNEQLSLKVFFQDNKLKFSGTVQMPTPCHNLTTESMIAESYPEKVSLYLNAVEPRSGDVCAEVVTPKEFSGEIQASEESSIRVIFNGKEVK